MKKVLFGLLFALCLCVMLYSGYQLYTIYSDYGAADDAYDEVVNQFVTPAGSGSEEDVLDIGEGWVKPTRDPADETVEETIDPNAAPICVDWEALLKVNSNVVGWLYCPDTSINYPIVQTGNNEDYLRRLLDGSYNRSGTIFMDYRNESDFTSYNSIIYGHNMGSGKMFAPLMNYRKQSYYDEHPTMYLLTPGGSYRLDVLAGAVVDAYADYYETAHTADSFRSFLNKISRNSTFRSGVDVSAVERTVMLSTCTNGNEDDRYILVCALVALEG